MTAVFSHSEEIFSIALCPRTSFEIYICKASQTYQECINWRKGLESQHCSTLLTYLLCYPYEHLDRWLYYELDRYQWSANVSPDTSLCAWKVPRHFLPYLTIKMIDNFYLLLGLNVLLLLIPHNLNKRTKVQMGTVVLAAIVCMNMLPFYPAAIVRTLTACS